MFGRPLRHCRRPPAVLPHIAILAAALLAARPAYAFGLSGAQVVEGFGKVADGIEAAQEAQRQENTVDEQFIDDQLGKIADKAADEFERGFAKTGGKVWETLTKSDSKVGELAKKAARRWGPAVRRGLRLAGPAGRIVDTADAGYTIGSAIARLVTVPLIDSYFEGKSRVLEEQIRRDVEEIRKRGEFSRKLDDDIAAFERASQAMDEEERRLYGSEGGSAASDSRSDNESSAGSIASSSATSNETNPWSQDDVVGNQRESGREQWDRDASDAAWELDQRARGCEGDWGDCPGNEYWNEALQAKARRLDPWAAYRKASPTAITDGEHQAKAGADEPGAVAARDCEGDWADCSEPRWDENGTNADSGNFGEREQAYGSPRASDPPGGTYGMASAATEGSYRDVLKRLDEEDRRKIEVAERQRERERAAQIQQTQTPAGNSAPPSVTAPTSTGSADAGQQEPETLSSNCEEQPLACKRAARSAETQTAPLELAFKAASSISEQKVIYAQIVQIAIVGLRTCSAAESRPHCKSNYHNAIQELEKSLRSVGQ